MLGPKNTPFYIFILAFFVIMIGPYLLSHGMFMDGIIYATVSNNLANGVGSFSDLAFSETDLLHFREHPPLAFWIQSFFYNFFGDSYVIEKIYSAFMFIVTGLIIRQIWILLTNHKKLAWLPLLFWVSIPIITQAARNNLLENTMMVFTTAALYFLIKADKKAVINLVLAGFMIYLGFITKGFVALFLWSFPFWLFVFEKEKSFLKFIKNMGLLVLFTALPFLLLSLIYPASYTYLLDYFDIQVANSLLNVQTVDSRFWIIGKLVQELITPLILLIVVYAGSKLLKIQPATNSDHKITFVLFAVALSGVLPIIISLKQSGFYIIPAYPIFALAFALLCKNKVAQLYEKLKTTQIGYKLFAIISATGLAVGLLLIIVNAGEYSRDAEKLEDIEKIAKIVGDHSILQAEATIRSDWSSKSYLNRYYKISLKLTSKPTGRYYLTTKSISTDLEQYTLKDSTTVYFNLYERK